MANLDLGKIVTFNDEELMDIATYMLNEAALKSDQLDNSTAHAAAAVGAYTSIGNLAMQILRMRDEGYTGSNEKDVQTV